MVAATRIIGLALAVTVAAGPAVAAEKHHHRRHGPAKPWWAVDSAPKAPVPLRYNDGTNTAPSLVLGPLATAKEPVAHVHPAPVPLEFRQERNSWKPETVAPQQHEPSLEQPPAPTAAPRMAVAVAPLPPVAGAEAPPATPAPPPVPAVAAPAPPAVEAPAAPPSPQHVSSPLPLALGGTAGALSLIAAAVALVRRRSDLVALAGRSLRSLGRGLNGR